jgi:hypothetical protein
MGSKPPSESADRWDSHRLGVNGLDMTVRDQLPSILESLIFVLSLILEGILIVLVELQLPT